MNPIVNTLLLVLIWVIYLTSSWLYLRRRQFSMRMGLNFGILHMVLLPFTVFAFEKSLSGDTSGLIPSVNWTENSSAIFRVMLMVGFYGVWDLACLAISQEQTPKSRTGRSIWNLLPKFQPFSLIIAFIVGSVLLFVITGIASGGHWAESKGEFFITWGTPGVLISNTIGAIRIATLVALAAVYLHGRVSVKWFVGWMSVLCVIDLYTTGNRIFTLQVLVVIATLFLAKRQWFLLFMFGLAAIPFGVLMTMFSLIRVYMHNWAGGSGLSSAGAALGEGYMEAKDAFLPSLGIPEFLMGISEGINVNVLVVVIEDFHRSVGMLMGSSLLRGFVFWIPRSIWPGKPETLTVLIGQRLMGSDRVSMGATIFGEFWANFGLLGVLLIPPVLYLINRAFSMMIRDATMRSIAVFVFGYTVVRLPVSDFTVQFLFVVVILNMTNLKLEKKSGLPAQ